MLIAARLDHIAIAAHDTTAMIQWYGRVLGLVVHAEGGGISASGTPEQKTYLIGPPLLKGATGRGITHGMMMEIMPLNDTPRRDRAPRDPGLSHVAWFVPDFDAALRHLKDCGVRFLSEVIQAVGGGRIISFADNEGNMMQIVERPA